MDRPMTTEEFFDKICGILKKKGMMPDILDYSLATHAPASMTTYEFELGNNLCYGGSEGIYLDLWITRYKDGQKQVQELGTFKTLDRSDEAMHVMARLLADFIIEANSYVNGNLDDFTWEGADVHAFDKDGNKLKWGYSCGTMEKAMARKDELLERYPSVVVRDNATRKEKLYRADSPEKSLTLQNAKAID